MPEPIPERLPIYATITFRHKRSGEPPRDWEARLASVVPQDKDLDALSAFREIGANAEEYGRGAVILSRGGGFAYVLRPHGHVIHLLSCSTLPACSAVVLLDDAMQRAREGAARLGDDWRQWTVSLSEARGNRILTARPIDSWCTVGGLRAPLTEVGFVVATAALSWFWDKQSATHLFAAACVLTLATALRLLVAWVLDKPRARSYAVTDG